MVQEAERQNGDGHASAKGLYERTNMGFRNYWYPVLVSNEVKEKPRLLKLLGDDVTFIRRNGKAYAIADHCPHRGTSLSLGKYAFKGSNTLSCVYHGWTFDVTNGACVAALTDGPDSPVVGKVKIRIYPVEERHGIIWIWMGKDAPVPVEEDIPIGMQRASVVKVYRRYPYGNWRWHVENVGMGHAPMLHRDSIHMWFSHLPGFAGPFASEVDTEGEDGEWVLDRVYGVGMFGDYPGLGKWPHKWPWQRIGKTGGGSKKTQGREKPLLGVETKVSVKLPGTTRVPHFPIAGSMYYEWYVQTDEDHYIYFQTSCGFPTNVFSRLWFLARFYTWGRYTGMNRFNSQDLSMVRDSHNLDKATGGNVPSRLYRPDAFQFAWREYAAQYARGEGSLVTGDVHAKAERVVAGAAPDAPDIEEAGEAPHAVE